MSLVHHEIAEGDHRILNPFSEAKLRLLGEVSDVGAGTRILDLACGKGELLCRWAEWFGSGGIGVDISTVFLAAAGARAAELGVADRVSFVQGDAGVYEAEAASFDVAACIGATWIGGGLAGTVDLLRPAIRPGGRLLVGEPYWIDPPPAEAYEALETRPGEFVSLAETVARLDVAGLEVVEMVLANGDDWDRYVASQWRTVDAWLLANPGHAEAEAMRAYLARERASHVAVGRRYLGWGVFVTRPR